MDGHGGTCVSLPMLFLAVGRRIGYPLYLCEAREHYFLRWEGKLPGQSRERFNIECTSQGFTPHDDEHFKHRPKPIPPERLNQGIVLKNHAPRQYLAALFIQRSNCLFDQWQLLPACEAAYHAHQLWPEHPGIAGSWAIHTMARDVLLPVLPQIARGEVPVSFDCTCGPAAEPWRRHIRPLVVEDVNRLLRRHHRRLADERRASREVQSLSEVPTV